MATEAIVPDLEVTQPETPEVEQATETAPEGQQALAQLQQAAQQLPPEAQAKAFQALGLQVAPEELQPQEQTHEITEETEGLNPQTGVPTKRKVSVVGKPLQ